MSEITKYLGTIEFDLDGSGKMVSMEIHRIPSSNSFVGLDCTYLEQVSETVNDPYNKYKELDVGEPNGTNPKFLQLLFKWLIGEINERDCKDMAKHPNTESYLDIKYYIDSIKGLIK